MGWVGQIFKLFLLLMVSLVSLNSVHASDDLQDSRCRGALRSLADLPPLTIHIQNPAHAAFYELVVAEIMALVAHPDATSYTKDLQTEYMIDFAQLGQIQDIYYQQNGAILDFTEVFQFVQANTEWWANGTLFHKQKHPGLYAAIKTFLGG